jgi:hypothetical protein
MNPVSRSPIIIAVTAYTTGKSTNHIVTIAVVIINTDTNIIFDGASFVFKTVWPPAAGHKFDEQSLAGLWAKLPFKYIQELQTAQCDDPDAFIKWFKLKRIQFPNATIVSCSQRELISTLVGCPVQDFIDLLLNEGFVIITTIGIILFRRSRKVITAYDYAEYIARAMFYFTRKTSLRILFILSVCYLFCIFAKMPFLGHLCFFVIFQLICMYSGIY